MYFRFSKSRYVKPYVGFTHLDTDISQTVRRICVVRDLDSRTSRKLVMDLPPLEFPELSAGKCDNASCGPEQKNALVRYFDSHSNQFSRLEVTRRRLKGHLKMKFGLKSAFSIVNNQVDPAGCISTRKSDTSTIEDFSTSKHNSPPPDDDMYIFNNLPPSPPALDSGHEFTLVKDELTDYVKRSLHDQVKHMAKRSKLDSPISQKRNRPRINNFRACEEAEDYLDSDPDATLLENIPKEATRRTLSCPFYLHDRRRHRDCLKSAAGLRNIKAVKQYLWHAHRQPPYCSICRCIFRTSVECDEYIRAVSPLCKRECRQSTPEGISEAQVLQLAKRSRLTQSDESTWFSIWEVLFPGEDKLRQPFLNYCGELEAAICRLHTF